MFLDPPRRRLLRNSGWLFASDANARGGNRRVAALQTLAQSSARIRAGQGLKVIVGSKAVESQ
jgi:hypothetical protein